MNVFRLLSGKIERATIDSAAFDLFYAGDVDIFIGDKPVAVPTGVRSAFSPGLMAKIWEKSGLSLKGIEVKGGVIDADYRDEWKVVLRYAFFQEYDAQKYSPFCIKPGMKIAQFTLIELPRVTFEAGEGVISTVETVRIGGFGSTGS